MKYFVVLIVSYFLIFSTQFFGQSNWHQIPSPGNLSSYEPRSLQSGYHNDLVLNTSNGVFNSFNSGNDWFSFDNFSKGVGNIIIQDSTYIVFFNHSFGYSTDIGKTWQLGGPLNYPYYSDGMAFSKTYKDYFYIALEYYINPYQRDCGLYYCSNHGSYMDKVAGGVFLNMTIIPGDTIYANMLDYPSFNPLGLKRYLAGRFDSYMQGLPEYSNTCIGNDKNLNIYTSSASGIYQLHKQTNNWERVDSVMTNVTKFLFNNYNQMLILRSGNLYVANANKSWYNVTPDSLTGTVSEFCMDSLGYYYVVGNTGKIHKSNIPAIINTLPSIPVLAAPANFQSISSDSANFKWNPSSPLPIKYFLVLSTDSTFTNSLQYEVGDTCIIIPSLSANKKYFWKVKSFNEAGWGPFSNTSIFNTFLTSTRDNGNKIFRFELTQNYPNPFNPNTVISYSLPSASNVRLIVYNALGQVVSLLENEYRSSGSYSVTFNATELPSGIYFYKLEAGQFTQVKKMMVIK